MIDINASAIEMQIQSIEGDLVIDSRLVSKRLGIEHINFMETIGSFQTRIEQEFGIVRFETEKLKRRGRPQNYAFLNEDQAVFLVTLSRNTPQVVDCKVAIVKAFSKARKLLSGKLDMVELVQTQIAFAFVKEMYSPWRKTNPEADPYFRKLVAIPVQSIEPSEPQALQSQNVLAPLDNEYFKKEREMLLGTINDLGANINRVGLAGNKSIKEAEFLAKQLDRVRELFDEQEAKIKRLNEALKDSGAQIERLQKELKIANAVTESANAKTDGYDAVYRSHKMEISQLKSKITDLEMQLRLQNTAPTLTIAGPEFLGLPPAA